MAFVKRVLVGRPLATTEKEHQRIPKTIALAVFSSDAISSTAYATEEILFVVAVGGVEPRARPRHADPDRDRGRGPAGDRRHVVPADDLRLPERRRQLRRQPREPRREPVAGRRRVAARRLHPHRRGVDLRRRRRHHVDPRVPRPRRSTASRSGSVLILAHQPRQPARHQGVGPHLRGAHLHLHRDPRPRSWATACSAASCSTTSAASTRSPFKEEGDNIFGGDARHLPPPEGLLVGRGRAHRCRGDLQRRARVPPPGVEERGHDAGVDGRSSSARCSSACRCSPTTSARTRASSRP